MTVKMNKSDRLNFLAYLLFLGEVVILCLLPKALSYQSVGLNLLAFGSTFLMGGICAMLFYKAHSAREHLVNSQKRSLDNKRQAL